MSTLPSGLPVVVGDAESLARIVIFSKWVAGSTGRVKYPAFLPAPDHETSVFRKTELTDEQLWELGAEAAERGTLYGAAVVQTGVVRRAGLDALASEPPPHHANLIRWPVLADDPELQKARRKEMAAEIAEEAWYLPRK